MRKLNKHIAKIFGLSGITLYPFGVFIAEKHSDHKRDITHEYIHLKQQKEMFVIGFFALYLLEWMLKSIIFFRNAYFLISFEQEAYRNEHNLKYPDIRKNYNWIIYIFVKP